MSSEIYFSNNYRDLCDQHGTGAGFQFEFHCSRCFDTWRSPFENFTAGRMASWLSRGVTAAWSVIGGRAGSGMSSAADGLAGASWGGTREAAFQRAVDTARGHFNRCGRCSSYVCDRCWNPEHGLCLNCAPDTAAEAEAARRRGINDMASQQAYAQGQVQGKDYDPTAAGVPAMPGRNTRRAVLRNLWAPPRPASALRLLPGRGAGQLDLLPILRRQALTYRPGRFRPALPPKDSRPSAVHPATPAGDWPACWRPAVSGGAHRGMHRPPWHAAPAPTLTGTAPATTPAPPARGRRTPASPRPS